MVEPISRHDPLEVGWVAGIIDGEGYIGLVRQSFYKETGDYTLMPDIHVANTNYELLRRYTQILHKWKIHFHYLLSKRQKPGYHPLLSVRVSRINSAERLLSIIIDHLTSKKPAAEVVLEFCRWKQSLRLTRRRKRDKNGRLMPGRARTDDEVAKEQEFYERLEAAKRGWIDVSQTTRRGSHPLALKPGAEIKV